MNQELFIVRICPHVYSGNAKAATNLQLLQKKGITQILGLTNKGWEAPKYRQFGIEKREFIIQDHREFRDPEQRFKKELVPWIDRLYGSKKATMIHCLQGSSRSSACTIGYLVSNDVSFWDAVHFVTQKDNLILPNFRVLGSFLAVIGSVMPDEYAAFYHSRLPLLFKAMHERGIKSYQLFFVEMREMLPKAIRQFFEKRRRRSWPNAEGND